MHADINMEFNILGEFSLLQLVSEYSAIVLRLCRLCPLFPFFFYFYFCLFPTSNLEVLTPPPRPTPRLIGLIKGCPI